MQQIVFLDQFGPRGHKSGLSTSRRLVVLLASTRYLETVRRMCLVVALWASPYWLIYDAILPSAAEPHPHAARQNVFKAERVADGLCGKCRN